MAANSENKLEPDPEHIEMMKFLIEKCKDAKSPLIIKNLAREYKEESGSSQQLGCLLSRFIRFRRRIHEMRIIDTEMKARMLFALSASIDKDFLNELRKDADVEVDDNNRITKYKANNGSLELEGDHSQSAKTKAVSAAKWNDYQKELMPKTPGAVKRAAAAEVPNSSKKARTDEVKSEDYAPDDSAGIPGTKAANPEMQLLRQPKLEEAGASFAQTPQTKFLEAIQFLIVPLDVPSFTPLKAKIDKFLRKSPNAKIPNNEMILAMELFVTKITNSVQTHSESVESVSLKVFMSYLKSAILNSKLEGLETLMEKINENINEPASKDTNIPLEKVATALQSILDVIGF